MCNKRKEKSKVPEPTRTVLDGYFKKHSVITNLVLNIWVFPKIGGTPKWMVYNGSKPYEQMDDLGGPQPPLFLVQHPYKTKQLFLGGLC